MGWKAPPKPQAKEPLRQPTETQAAAAKRLSQGLSVNTNANGHSSRTRNANPYGNVASSSFSVVLDSNSEYPLYDGQGMLVQQQQQQMAAHETSPWLATASTKASR